MQSAECRVSRFCTLHSALCTSQRLGFSLVELIVVILILAILATLAIPYLGSGVHERLDTAAVAVVSDLEMARSLAVSNSSSYRITFDTVGNKYELAHVGTNQSLDVLPATPFHRVSENGRVLTAEMKDMPLLGGEVQLLSVLTNQTPPAEIGDVEFNRLGGTARAEETVLWLASGYGEDRRYLSIVVNPTTGLAEPKPPAQKAKPAGVLDPIADLLEDILKGGS